MKSKLSFDVVHKDFFQNKERLANLLNATLLEGEPFIRPDRVETMDSDSSSLVEVERGRFNTAKRLRNREIRDAVEGIQLVYAGTEGILKQLVGDVSIDMQTKIMNCSSKQIEKLLDNLCSIKNENEIDAYLN